MTHTFKILSNHVKLTQVIFITKNLIIIAANNRKLLYKQAKLKINRTSKMNDNAFFYTNTDGRRPNSQFILLMKISQ